MPEVTRQLCEIHNLRMRINRLKVWRKQGVHTVSWNLHDPTKCRLQPNLRHQGHPRSSRTFPPSPLSLTPPLVLRDPQYEGEELAKHGPAKDPNLQGLDEYQKDFYGKDVEKNAHYCPDPTGRRCGNPADPTCVEKLRTAVAEAVEIASKDQVGRKVKLTKDSLEQAIDTVRGAVMICFPMGLPEYDGVRAILEGNEDLTGTSYQNDPLTAEECVIWFAGKQMDNKKVLKDHVGRNDKTKVIVKVQKAGAHAPSREAPVDEETQKAMLAWYHKRQEAQKKLEEDAEDRYGNSDWASGGSLKSHLSGMGGDVKIR